MKSRLQFYFKDKILKFHWKFRRPDNHNSTQNIAIKFRTEIFLKSKYRPNLNWIGQIRTKFCYPKRGFVQKLRWDLIGLGLVWSIARIRGRLNTQYYYKLVLEISLPSSVCHQMSWLSSWCTDLFIASVSLSRSYFFLYNFLIRSTIGLRWTNCLFLKVPNSPVALRSFSHHASGCGFK